MSPNEKGRKKEEEAVPVATTVAAVAVAATRIEIGAKSERERHRNKKKDGGNRSAGAIHQTQLGSSNSRKAADNIFLPLAFSQALVESQSISLHIKHNICVCLGRTRKTNDRK